MRDSRPGLPIAEPIGTFEWDISPYGVCDLAGGVADWCIPDPRRTALMSSIEWINSFPKPEAAYRARMLQIAQDETGDTSPSRLGLVRIAFEGNCRLSAKIEKGAVTVSALLLRDD